MAERGLSKAAEEAIAQTQIKELEAASRGVSTVFNRPYNPAKDNIYLVIEMSEYERGKLERGDWAVRSEMGLNDRGEMEPLPKAIYDEYGSVRGYLVGEGLIAKAAPPESFYTLAAKQREEGLQSNWVFPSNKRSPDGIHSVDVDLAGKHTQVAAYPWFTKDGSGKTIVEIRASVYTFGDTLRDGKENREILVTPIETVQMTEARAEEILARLRDEGVKMIETESKFSTYTSRATEIPELDRNRLVPADAFVFSKGSARASDKLNVVLMNVHDFHYGPGREKYISGPGYIAKELYGMSKETWEHAQNHRDTENGAKVDEIKAIQKDLATYRRVVAGISLARELGVEARPYYKFNEKEVKSLQILAAKAPQVFVDALHDGAKITAKAAKLMRGEQSLQQYQDSFKRTQDRGSESEQVARGRAR